MKVSDLIKGMLWGVLFCALISMCGGCKTKEYTHAETSEKIITEVRHEKVFVKDTVLIDIPLLTSERETRDSSSHLENEFAVSDVKIYPDGTLFHDLKTQPQKKSVPVDKEIERNDRVVYVDKLVKVPVTVERSLSSWERTCIKWYPYSVAALLLVLVYVFRKPMRSLIRRFI